MFGRIEFEDDVAHPAGHARLCLEQIFQIPIDEPVGALPDEIGVDIALAEMGQGLDDGIGLGRDIVEYWSPRMFERNRAARNLFDP